MSLSSRFARLALKAVAIGVLVWSGSAVRAADVVKPVPVSAGPVVAGDPGCATCQHGAPVGGCATCKHHVLLAKNKTPYQVNLCPGACFGYFQTQWRKWDETCPYPYIGQGVGDAPRPPSPRVNVPLPGGTELNPPRTLPGTDPKDSKGTVPIPPIPGGKFAP